jgi:hypothetical protein
MFVVSDPILTGSNDLFRRLLCFLVENLKYHDSVLINSIDNPPTQAAIVNPQFMAAPPD